MFFRDVYPETVPHITSHSYDDLARIRKSSHKEVRMVCPKGFETVSTFNRIDRILRAGRNFCQHCENGSIFDELPFLVDYYAGDADPHTIRRMSKVPVQWRDGLGVWEESPYSIYRRRVGISPGSVRRSIETFPEAASMWDDPKPMQSVPPMSHYEAWWRCGEGHRFRRKVYQIARSPNCPVCCGFAVGDDGATARVYPSVYSKQVRSATPHFTPVSELEADVRRAVVGMAAPGTKVRANDRAAVPEAGELDIYLPDMRIGIEVNGLYWHSEARRPRTYHLDKLAACRAAGVRLIQVWEDDWRDRREIVTQMLAVRLGVDMRPSIGARKTAAARAGYAEAAAFLSEHHLQGPATGTFYDGLYGPGGELVAVMVTKRQGQTYRIDRFATAVRVPGGFGKLLAALRRRVAASGGGSIVTFSDNEISDGDLYRGTGFCRDGELRPDYMYLVNRTRQHKFGYRIGRFRRDPELRFEEGLTERELAELNGLHRVWDSGKVRWKMEVPAD